MRDDMTDSKIMFPKVLCTSLFPGYFRQRQATTRTPNCSLIKTPPPDSTPQRIPITHPRIKLDPDFLFFDDFKIMGQDVPLTRRYLRDINMTNFDPSRTNHANDKSEHTRYCVGAG
jgi:hypothetical protein